MASFDEVSVQARRNGVGPVDNADQLFAMNQNGSVFEVVHAFALAGYPPVETISGVSHYLDAAGKMDGDTFALMLDKMREVGYIESEIQEALTHFKG